MSGPCKERGAVTILRDICGAGIAFSAAATCKEAAHTSSDWIATAFSDAVYQGVMYDAAGNAGVFFGTLMALSATDKLYKKMLG
ncbi:MAG: hypothetical protein WC989_09350 [Micavibrio sp.]